MFVALCIVTAIACLELGVIVPLSNMYKRKANEIKYYKPVEIGRKD